MAEKEKIFVSREEYFRELGRLSGKIRRRRRLRSEYFSLMARIRWYPERREEFLARMRDIREILAELEASIELERAEIARKVIPPPPPKRVLSRIKVRIYNEERKPTPKGMFQTFWDVDAMIDPETGLVDWDYEFKTLPEDMKKLTRFEINLAKHHMIGYFKGMAKWRTPEQLSLAYFDSPEGIPYETEAVKYKRKVTTGEPYAKNIPIEAIRKAERLTVGELIVGISSVEPKPVKNPEEEMGVFFQRAMIVTYEEEGAITIKWDEIINKYIWRPSKEIIEKIKKELRLRG